MTQGDNWWTPWMFYRQPPTKETKQVSPTTENLIPFLHFLAFAFAVAAGLTAATVVWSLWWPGDSGWFACDVTKLVIVGGLVVLSLLLMLRAGAGGIWILLFGLGLAGATWLLWDVIIAEAWPTFRLLATFGAFGTMGASVYLAISSWRELYDPWRPLDPQTRVQMRLANILEQEARVNLLLKVDELRRRGIDIPPAIHVSVDELELARHFAQDRRARFQAFLQNAAQDTRREFLRRCGWSDEEIQKYKRLLCSTGWAVDRGYHGWQLLYPVGEIMQAYTEAGLHAAPRQADKEA